MILWDVEGFKVVEVILNLRSREHLESGLTKDFFDPKARTRHRMQAACLLTAAGQGDIDLALGQLPFHRRLFEPDAMHLERGVDRRLGVVDALARSGTFRCGQRTQTFELLGEQTLLAEQPHAHLVERDSGRSHSRAPVDSRQSACAMVIRARGSGFRADRPRLSMPRGWLWLFPRSL